VSAHNAAQWFERRRRIIIVDGLPKTATGKIRRFARREQLDRPL